MGKKRTLRQLLLFSLAIIMVLATMGCSNLKKQVKNKNLKQLESKNTKPQFKKAFKEIADLDRKAFSGILDEDDQSYSEKDYGKFVALIDTEKEYYLALNDIVNTFEEESMKVLEEDMNLESVDDTKKIRQAADNLEKAVNNYLENILKLNEDNIKVLETLDLPEEYKGIYIDWKKEVKKIFDINAVKADEDIKNLSAGLKEMADILDEVLTETDLAKVNEYIERIEKIAEMAENIEKSLTDREEEVTEEIKKDK